MDNPEAMRVIIEDIFVRQQLWTLLWVLLVALLSAVSAFGGAYLKQRGENYATSQDFNTLKEQLGQNTRVVEDAKATIQQLHWPVELAQELQKTRGVERQELRFKSYGALWKELRPLAIYDATDIDKEEVGDMSSKLSNWYFSEYGGLLLTPQAREFYFALQDLLQVTSDVSEEWSAGRSEESEGDQKAIFRRVLQEWSDDKLMAISVLDYFETSTFEHWQKEATDLGKKWREGVKDVATAWSKLDEKQRFATLQQVGSILRTSLVNDLESRHL